MAKRVCVEPGCPEIVDAGRCAAHTREVDKARGTRQARGYDLAHGRERARLQRAQSRGELLICARCGTAIALDEPWHLDHDEARTGYLGPSHAGCNLSAAGRAAHR